MVKKSGLIVATLLVAQACSANEGVDECLAGQVAAKIELGNAKISVCGGSQVKIIVGKDDPTTITLEVTEQMPSLGSAEVVADSSDSTLDESAISTEAEGEPAIESN